MGWLGLSLVALFVLPIAVSGCLPDPRSGVPWHEARRDPTGLAPDPATTQEAIVQVYAARAVSWRGVFAVRFLTTDLTAEYVRINADYST